MAKRTSTKGASKKTKTPDRVVGKDHNSKLTDEQRTALLLQACKQIEAKQTEMATINAAIRNLRKTAKADGISPAELNFALHLRKADPDEATALFRQQVQIAKWLSHPIGKQAELFDADRTPIEDRAFEEGKIAGLEGLTAKPPYDAVAGQKWMDGWHAGQAVLAGGIKTKAAEEPGHQTLIKGEPIDDELEDENVVSGPWSGNAPSAVN